MKIIFLIVLVLLAQMGHAQSIKLSRKQNDSIAKIRPLPRVNQSFISFVRVFSVRPSRCGWIVTVSLSAG